MRKKGFTLVELMSVIVVLGIIALIMVPVVVNVIGDSKKKAFKAKVEVAYENLKKYAIDYDYTPISTTGITVEDLKKIADNDFTGGKFIEIDNKVQAWYITDGKYCAKGTMRDLEIEKECTVFENQQSIFDDKKIQIISTQDSITVILNDGFINDKSLQITNYMISVGNKSITSDEIGIFQFDNIENNKTYTVTIDAKNGEQVIGTYEFEVNNGLLQTPTYTIDKEGWSQSKTITIDYKDSENKYKHEYSIDGGEKWQIYTNPVTLSQSGTIIARISDKNVYKYSSSQTIGQIDSTPPIAKFVVGSRTESSIVVTSSCKDDESQITKIEYSSDNGSSYINGGTNENYTFTGLSNGTNYSFKVRCTNGANVSAESSVVTIKTKEKAIFDGNGGTNGTSIVEDAGNMLGTLPSSTRKYYIFDGWYTSASGGTKITSSTLMPSGGATYYAHWSPTFAAIAKLGDYVTMTPTKTSFTTDKSKTGYSSNQTINPRELNVWRVISINSDGTIDMVSDDVSSVNIYFGGVAGYANFVSYLNILASQYTNSKYTIGSRHMGYNGQTPVLTNTSAFDGSRNTPPWTCITGPSCNSVESLGGGDTLYQKDVDAVQNAIGTMATKRSYLYWLASRRYIYHSDKPRFYFVGNVEKATVGLANEIFTMYNDGWSLVSHPDFMTPYPIRPIVVLKSNLSRPSGAGTSASPYVLP